LLNLCRGAVCVRGDRSHNEHPQPKPRPCYNALDMRRVLLPALVSLLWLLLLPCGAAAETRVVPLVPRMSPPSSAEIVNRLHSAVSEALASSPRIGVATPAEVRFAQSQADLAACDAAHCLARLASLLGAQRVVSTDIRVVGKTYTAVMRVFDALGRELGRTEKQCKICTLREVETTLEAGARELEPYLREGHPAPGRSEGAASSAPASLQRTGQGEGPSSAPTTQPGVSRTLGAWDQGMPSSKPPARRSPWWTRARTWNFRLIAMLAAVASLVGIATGAPLLALDGDPTCDLPDGRRTCPRVYATAAGGGTLVALGVVAAAVAGTSLYLHVKWRSWRVGVEPTAGSRSAFLTTRVVF